MQSLQIWFGVLLRKRDRAWAVVHVQQTKGELYTMSSD
jgi:hypothetical protein